MSRLAAALRVAGALLALAGVLWLLLAGQGAQRLVSLGWAVGAMALAVMLDVAARAATERAAAVAAVAVCAALAPWGGAELAPAALCLLVAGLIHPAATARGPGAARSHGGDRAAPAAPLADRR
ncbi:MAG: hypothetical protein AB7V42_01195 [Thermoleophilia bacterium]